MSTTPGAENSSPSPPLNLALVDSDIRLDAPAVEAPEAARPMVYEDEIIASLQNAEGECLDYSAPIPNPFRQQVTDDEVLLLSPEEPEAVPRPASNSPRYSHEDAMTPSLFRSLVRYFVWSNAPLFPTTVASLLRGAYDLLSALPTLLDLTVLPGRRLAVFGDIHGQFFDLLHALRLAGVDIDGDGDAPVVPADLQLLFLGDYVDRGFLGTEVVLTLCALKLLHPHSVHLIRGNHECRPIFSVYGFADECRRRYNAVLAECFADVFRVLPLAALVNERVFAVHAGPPLQARAATPDSAPTLVPLGDIRRFARMTDSPGGLAIELLWNDPDETLDGYKLLNDVISERLERGTPGPDPPKLTILGRLWELLRRRRREAETGGVAALPPPAPEPEECRDEDESAPTDSDDSGAPPSSMLNDQDTSEAESLRFVLFPSSDSAPMDDGDAGDGDTDSEDACLDEKAEFDYEPPHELDYGIMDGDGMGMDLDLDVDCGDDADDSDTEDSVADEAEGDTGNWEGKSVAASVAEFARLGITVYDYVRIKALGPPSADPVRIIPSPRGAGVAFSFAALREWMAYNGLTHVFRGHQAQQRGFARHWQQHADRDHLEFRTVFSAADYGHSGNMGAIAVLAWDEQGQVSITTQEWSPLLDLPRVQLPVVQRLPSESMYV